MMQKPRLLITLGLFFVFLAQATFAGERIPFLVRVYNPKGSPVPAHELGQRLEKARTILRQCDIELLFQLLESRIQTGDPWQRAKATEVIENKSVPAFFYGVYFTDPRVHVLSHAFSYADWGIGYSELTPLKNTAWFNFLALQLTEKDWYPDSFSVEAHEIGHLFGLSHVDADHSINLMQNDYQLLSADLTDDQCATMRARAKSISTLLTMPSDERK